MTADNDDDATNTGSDASNTGSDINSTGSDSYSTGSSSGSTGHDSSNAACARTLDTAELLDTILLFLPLRDLLQAHRVSKSWSTSITASIKTQRALFLEPQSDDFSHYLKWDCQEEEPEPPYPFFEEGESNKADPQPLRFIPLQHNGIISPHFQLDYVSPHQVHVRKKKAGMAPMAPGPFSKVQLCAIHRREASWRDMFVMQPPCRELSFLCCVVGAEVQEDAKRVVVINAEGVTMGNVVDCLCEHWFDCPLHATAKHRNGEGRRDFEGFLFTQLKVFSEEEVSDMSAWAVVQHLTQLKV